MEEIMSLDEALNHINSFIFIKNNAPHSLHSYISNTLKNIYLPIPTLHFKKGHHLFRCRKHYKNDPYFFEDIDELSYKKEIFNIKDFGRANEPVQSIFYCSDNFNTAIKESSTFYTCNKLVDEEITIGVWEVQKKIKIGNLIVKEFVNGIHNTNQTVKSMLDHFKKDMQIYPKDDIIVFETILSYFAEVFLVKTPTKEEYFITSALANYIYNEYGKSLSAFVYPSAIEPNIGMNFAIKPELLYKYNALKLVDACKIKLEKGIETSRIIAKDIDNKSKKIYWN